jgi:hypothetical protein
VFRLIYRLDGNRTERSFRSLDAARRYVLAQLGPCPQVCEAFGFLMEDDGGVIVPIGCSVQDLLPRRRTRGPRT